MSLAKSAIRAVLGSLAILVILCGAIALAIWTAVSLLGPFFSVAAWPLLFVLVIIPLLAQSLRQFRDLQFSGVVVFRRSAILAALTFVIVLGYFLLMELLGLSVHRIT